MGQMSQEKPRLMESLAVQWRAALLDNIVLVSSGDTSCP